MSLLIRPALADDVPALMSLEKHAATAAHWPPEQYQQLFAAAPQRLALVIEEEAGLRGFLVARRVDREWEIENIAIAGPARRRGLGSRLLGEFIDLLRKQGATSVFLEVRESNRAAQALYQKWGFEAAGRRSRYYENPAEDAVLYRLAFP